MNPTRHIEISIDQQTLDLLEGERLIRRFRVSTAAKGAGVTMGSHRTPTGRFRICEKIGEGEPSGTIFRERAPVGVWDGGRCGDDFILTRILRLDGLDPENANTLARCVYIHGTDREDLIGTPASHGCIRLGNQEMIELYDAIGVGTEVVVRQPTGGPGKLLFLDCDSTLSSIEGIDELAREMGPAVFAEVAALTNAAMNGEVAIGEVFSKRMDIIRPDRRIADRVAERYVATIVPGAREAVGELKANGWLPVILSGGFAPLIAPLARELGIDHVEAVPLHFNDDGSYAGYGEIYPTTRNMGKNEVIREWKAAMRPRRVVMVGDGVSDLETRPDVDLFIGFGGVVSRSIVRQGADHWIETLNELVAHRHILEDYGISCKSEEVN